MMVPAWRAVAWWAALAIICLVLVILALRGYHSPSLLIDLANMKLCGLAAAAWSNRLEASLGSHGKSSGHGVDSAWAFRMEQPQMRQTA